MKALAAGLMLVAVMADPLPQPAGATRFYTQWELHMRQVYRSDSDINREFGDAGATSGTSSGSDSGGNGGGGNGSSGSGSGPGSK